MSHSLRQLALKLSRSPNYFYVMKIEAHEKYNYIFKGGDVVQEYYNYVEEVENTFNDFVSMYYYLIENRKLTKFSKVAYKNLYKTSVSCRNAMDRYAVRYNIENVNIGTYKRVQALVAKYKEVKDDL